MKIKKIDSATNAIYKKLLSLTKNKGVQEHGQCLVSGEKIISELAADKPKNAFWIYHSDEHDVFKKYPLEQLILLPKKLFNELDLVGAPAPLLCMDTPMIEEWNSEAPLRSHELLCALGDPNNLGALLRSARAFNLQNIVLLEECCNPFHPKAVKASAGACFHLQFFSGPSIQKLATAKNILALDRLGKSLSAVTLDQKYRILLGEEGQGLPQNIKAQTISIPINDDVESLNATVAASILLYKLQ